MSRYRGPELLAAHHDVEGFDCGDEALNEWLRRRAPRNQREGSSRTWVVTDGAPAGGLLRVKHRGGRSRRGHTARRAQLARTGARDAAGPAGRGPRPPGQGAGCRAVEALPAQGA